MTTWFAQNSGVNIDSVNQWNDAANGSGNWLTWADLDAADVLVANGKTSITINVDVTCSEVTNGAGFGGTTGGYFVPAAGVVVTAKVSIGNASCIQSSLVSPGVFYVVGDVICDATADDIATIRNNASGVIHVTGNVYGNRILNSRSRVYGVYNTTFGTVFVVGTVTGGTTTQGALSARSCHGIANPSGSVTVTGTVIGGGNGDCCGIAGAASAGSGGTVTINGAVLSGSGSTGYACGLWVGGANSTITGDCIGGNSPAINNTSGTIAITGDLRPSLTSAAVFGAGTTILTGEIKSSESGCVGFGTGKLLLASPATHRYRRNDAGVAGTEITLSTAGDNQAATSDVRSGTVYGGGTGTLAVPDPAYVSLGVPIDDTVGTLTAGLDETALHDALDAYANKSDWKATQVDLVNAPNATALDAISSNFLSYEITKGDPGTIERAFWQSIKTTVSIDGLIVDNVANNSSTFYTDLSGADGQYDHQLIVITSGDLAGEARPIDSFTSTGGIIALQEPFTAEPTADDEFLILPYHVHPVTDIADSILTRNVSNVEASVDEHTLATMILGALEWSISGSVLTIKRTDGTTVHYTKAISSASSGDQVITGLA